MKEIMDQESKLEYMTTTPIPKLVGALAIPTIISMLITSFYNMVDSFFIGKISTSTSAAVGVALPLMAIIQAFGFTFGNGSGNYISRALGKGDKNKAEIMASTAFFSAFFVGIGLTVIGLLCLNPLTSILGATDTSYRYAKDYIQFILLGIPWIMSSFVLNNQLRFQGSAYYAMIGITIGAVVNIVLDPIFIFTCKLGIKGAAIATILSQFLSFIFLIAACKKGGNIKLSWKNFKPSLEQYKTILAGGLPSFFRQGLGSLAGVALNSMSRPYGDAAIAAMTIVNRLTMFAGAGLIGFGQGFQPVCGFNYGAKLYERVREAFYFCLKITIIALTVLAICGAFFAPNLVGLFRKGDAQVIAIGTVALQLQCITFPFMSWVILCNMMLQTIGKSFNASILATARQGLFFIPTLFLLSRQYGLLGIQFSQPIADLCALILAIPMGISVLKEMKE